MAKYILPCYVIYSNPCVHDQFHQIHVSVPAATVAWRVWFLTLTLCFVIWFLTPRVKKHMTTGESTKPHPSVQPKSRLKKHLDDEATIVHSETPRVKFMSGGQENTSTEQIAAKSMINNHMNGCPSSCETINTNAKTSKKVQPEASENCRDATCSSSQSIDISDQALSLLMRCHEIVADLKNSLGYVPIKL